MSIDLNHTIVWARDKEASARFLADLLGLAVEPRSGPFVPVLLGNGVILDFADADEVHPQHYAFLVGEDEFDAAFARICAAGIEYYADPFHDHPGRMNHRNGGRGLYFADPDGHDMELLTRA